MQKAVIAWISGGGGRLYDSLRKLFSILSPEKIPQIQTVSFVTVIFVAKNVKIENSILNGGKMKKGKAFTLAEVLITLGIIGIVAAMTLPVLVQNYQKRITATRLEATYSMIKQAIRMSEAKNGDVSEWNFDSLKEDGSKGVKLTQKFVKQYIEPYLKIAHKDEFAYSSAPYEYNYYSLNGKLISSSHTHYSLALNNGVYLHFNANYGDDNDNNFVELRIDINGKQRPNTVGIDTFFMHIYPEVKFYREGEKRDSLLERCKTPETGGNVSYQNACGALIQADGWEIKDDYPWK